MKNQLTQANKTLYEQELKKLTRNPWSQNLTEREIANISFAAMKCKPLTSKGVEVVFDALHSLQRFGVAQQETPTLLPGSKMWLLRRGRPLIGIEAMLFQGAHVSIHKSVWPNNLLMSLAGNAFCGPCAASSLIAALLAFHRS